MSECLSPLGTETEREKDPWCRSEILKVARVSLGTGEVPEMTRWVPLFVSLGVASNGNLLVK